LRLSKSFERALLLHRDALSSTADDKTKTRQQHSDERPIKVMQLEHNFQLLTKLHIFQQLKKFSAGIDETLEPI
jgi:hypothetical protein